MTETEFLDAYVSRVRAAVDSIDASELARMATAITDCVDGGGQVMFIGNGGSAATATHYVNDLVMAYLRTGRVVRASSLSDNPALVTGIANDYSYDDVYEYQLRALSQPGDLVIAISASGNSPNLVRAIEYAASAGLHTGAILGFDGGKLKGLADVVVHVPTGLGDYGPAEDVHLIVNHAVAALIRTRGE